MQIRSSHSSPVLLANLGSSGRLTLRQTTFAPMIVDESDESSDESAV